MAWETRFNFDGIDIKSRLRRIPDPLKGLQNIPVDIAEQMIDQALKEVYVPTWQEIRVIKKILGAAQAYARRHYKSEENFMRGVYSFETPFDMESAVTLLTSEAGIGKTQLYKALQELLGAPTSIAVTSDKLSYEVIGGAFTTVRNNQTPLDVLHGIAESYHFDGPTVSASRDALRQFRAQLYKRGCCFIFVDELQFLTLGAGANTLLTKTLYLLRNLGRPVFYIGNYSLGHRLKKRPQEDRHRLLSNPIILLPDSKTDPEYLEVLKAYEEVCAEFVQFDSALHAEQIYFCAGGNKRALRTLFPLAYRIARERGERERATTKVSIADLVAAYRSAEFSAFREDVVICREQLVKAKEVRRDLWCPFELPEDLSAVRAQLAKQASAAQLSSAILASSLTRAESDGVAQMRTVAGFDSPLPSPRPIPKSKRPRVTAAQLLSGRA